MVAVSVSPFRHVVHGTSGARDPASVAVVVAESSSDNDAECSLDVAHRTAICSPVGVDGDLGRRTLDAACRVGRRCGGGAGKQSADRADLVPDAAAGPAPSSQDAAGCSIAFSAVPSGSATPQMSVDTPGGLVGNPEYCDPAQSQTVSLVGYQDSQLGARFADYRIWLYVCADGSRWPVEQYVADNAPGYVLYSSHATAAVHAVLTGIAQTAQLPAITAPLRLSDLGIVRTVTAGAGGYQITVDRVVRGTSGLINNNPQTYPYDVPAAAVLPGQSLKVGDLVELATNGTTVTHLQVDPS